MRRKDSVCYPFQPHSPGSSQAVLIQQKVFRLAHDSTKATRQWMGEMKK